VQKNHGSRYLVFWTLKTLRTGQLNIEQMKEARTAFGTVNTLICRIPSGLQWKVEKISARYI
jgi:hypothetical protein